MRTCVKCPILIKGSSYFTTLLEDHPSCFCVVSGLVNPSDPSTRVFGCREGLEQHTNRRRRHKVNEIFYHATRELAFLRYAQSLTGNLCPNARARQNIWGPSIRDSFHQPTKKTAIEPLQCHAPTHVLLSSRWNSRSCKTCCKTCDKQWLLHKKIGGNNLWPTGKEEFGGNKKLLTTCENDMSVDINVDMKRSIRSDAKRRT
ncbi:hypothetical protein Naga_100139g9 [Nannochloropsis gaditana]|uniref:Uncharacterized protein n=1 Tax=Nannochloropsis gaditana TaxID=72520 RepID=W7TBH8_9STRA|nr:hypothetical protein Naga_100139g9 [Nannochloropsis gaditana]